MFGLTTINREIIEEDMHKRKYVFTENFSDDALKCRRRCFKPEHHHYDLKYAPFHHERRLLWIVRMHTDLIIPSKAIQKTIHLVSGYYGEYAIRES